MNYVFVLLFLTVAFAHGEGDFDGESEQLEDVGGGEMHFVRMLKGDAKGFCRLKYPKYFNRCIKSGYCKEDAICKEWYTTCSPREPANGKTCNYEIECKYGETICSTGDVLYGTMAKCMRNTKSRNPKRIWAVTTVDITCPQPPKPAELPECMCSTTWSVPEEPGCEKIQYGCPSSACDDKYEPRWCLLAENLCKPNEKYQVYLDDGYMECGDDSAIFGEDIIESGGGGSGMEEINSGATISTEAFVGEENNIALNISIANLIKWTIFFGSLACLGYYFGKREREKEEGYAFVAEDVEYNTMSNEMTAM